MGFIRVIQYCHGMCVQREEVDVDMDNRLENMIFDIGLESFKCAVVREMDKVKKRFIKLLELLKDMSFVSQGEEVDIDMNDQLEDMICDIGSKSFQRVVVCDNLCSDAK
ncbi:hypothetical protein CR513_55927, partial [Mucuna pruriens]